MAEINIVVAAGHVPFEVAERLRAAGMSVGAVLAEIDVITGTAPDSIVPGLANVEGVAAVEPAGSVQLPPPDAPIQ